MFTGQRFRILKSGTQGGIDVLEDFVGNGSVIALEGKRYGEDTALPLDQLKYKLFAASQTCDCYETALTPAEVTKNDGTQCKAKK